MKVISMNRIFTPGNKSGGSIYAGNLLFGGSGLKSTKERSERQQQMAGEVGFWEQQKENLKNRECGTVEEIGRKLEELHTYEDEIRAAKMAYNQEQMFHTMDEARELGEKIAEAAKELEPKTPEERKEEAAKEAAGIEKDQGILSEILDEATEAVEESVEDLTGGLEDHAAVRESSGKESMHKINGVFYEGMSDSVEMPEEQLLGKHINFSV